MSNVTFSSPRRPFSSLISCKRSLATLGSMLLYSFRRWKMYCSLVVVRALFDRSFRFRGLGGESADGQVPPLAGGPEAKAYPAAPIPAPRVAPPRRAPT